MSSQRKSSPINFAQGFTDFVNNTQRVWEHDRSQTLGASEVFRCWRMGYFSKIHPELAEVPEDADENWGHTERGNLIENEFVVPCLRTMFGEDKCFYMGEEQKTFVDGRLSATPDGLVIDLEKDALSEYGVEDIGSREIATEVKSFGNESAAPKKKKDEKGVVRYVPKDWHKGQNIVQMGIMRRQTNYKPETGVVLYVNPVNLKDIRPAIVKYDDGIYNQAKKRAEKIFEPGVEAKDFPAEGLLTNGCTFCLFQDACNKVEMSRRPKTSKDRDEVSEDDYEAVAALAKEVATLRKDHKRLEEVKKAAESKLRDLMFEVGTNRLGGDDWSVSISENGGRKSLDKDKIVEDTGIDLDDYQKEGKPYFVTRVKYDGEG